VLPHSKTSPGAQWLMKISCHMPYYRGVNKWWRQTLLCNSRCRRCYHRTREIVPTAQPERENHNGITSAVRLELLSQGPSVDGFSFNGWSTTRESSFDFSARSASRPKTFRHVSRHSSETSLTTSGVSGGGASMFGKDVKTCMTKCDPADHQLTFLTSEF
jgi:hypothetical protein